jgi:hypothetical protein
MVLPPLCILPTFDTLSNRVAYLKALLDFTSDDAAALQSLAANPVIKPLLPAVLDTVCMKLFSFDAEIPSHLSAPRDMEGTTKSTRVPTLNLSQNASREFLKTYLFELVTADYDADEVWEHLDRMVVTYIESISYELGSTYTSVTCFLGASPWVRKGTGSSLLYFFCLSLGQVDDTLSSTILDHPTLDNETKTSVLRAFNKVMWIQNDSECPSFFQQSSCIS